MVWYYSSGVLALNMRHALVRVPIVYLPPDGTIQLPVWHSFPTCAYLAATILVRFRPDAQVMQWYGCQHLYGFRGRPSRQSHPRVICPPSCRWPPCVKPIGYLILAQTIGGVSHRVLVRRGRAWLTGVGISSRG